jgi:amidase
MSPDTLKIKPAALRAASALVMMDAGSLAETLRERRASCVEVMTAFLDHIETLNPKVNAIVALRERAELLAEARERDLDLARGECKGPLHGLPHAVKDLELTRAIPTTMGSPILKDFVPPADSLMVQRLRAAGAIIIGKTNTPEFGLGSHTYNPVYGVTRNAYDPARSAGGSSGGAAVALALRLVPLADGSDYGGSLRNPAGWNGVFGFRTSIGRIPTEAIDAWLPSMGVLGPMARNVEDLSLLLSVQAGFDARVPLSLDGTGSPYARPPRVELKGTRIAWAGDFGGQIPCEPEVLAVCARAVRTLESVGCVVDEASPRFDLETLWQAAVRLRGWQMGSLLKVFHDDPVKRALLKPEAIFEFETGARQSAYDISAASAVRTEWYRTLQRFFERYDFFVAPTAQIFPFEAERLWPREVAGRTMRTYHEWMAGALIVTMSGCPSLAAPAGFSARGLPIGIQIVAPNRRELECLALARAYETAMDLARQPLPALLTEAT